MASHGDDQEIQRVPDLSDQNDRRAETVSGVVGEGVGPRAVGHSIAPLFTGVRAAFQNASNRVHCIRSTADSHEFKQNHGEWINSVKPTLDPAITAQLHGGLEIAAIDIENCHVVRNKMRSALSNRLKNVRAYLRRGTAREMLGYYQEAIEDFRYALVLELNNKRAAQSADRLKNLFLSSY